MCLKEEKKKENHDTGNQASLIVHGAGKRGLPQSCPWRLLSMSMLLSPAHCGLRALATAGGMSTLSILWKMPLQLHSSAPMIVALFTSPAMIPLL